MPSSRVCVGTFWSDSANQEIVVNVLTQIERLQPPDDNAAHLGNHDTTAPEEHHESNHKKRIEVRCVSLRDAEISQNHQTFQDQRRCDQTLK